MRVIGTALIAMAACLFSFAGASDAFESPEYLEYAIKWTFVTAGTATLEIKPVDDDKMILRSTAYSEGIVSRIYFVEDLIDATVSTGPAMLPYSYIINTTEGSKHRNESTYFDFKTGKADFSDHKHKRYAIYNIPEPIYDPLSALYRARVMELEVGKSVYIPIFDSEMVYDLEVQVIKRERVEVPAGEFDTIHVRPLLQSEGIFSRSGPIDAWLTDDDRKIPVLIKTKVFIGHLQLVLKDIRTTESISSESR